MNKVLVTGAGGFIGSHLTEALIKQGHQVTAFVRYNSQNNYGWLEYSKCKDNVKIIRGDIRDYDSVYNALLGCDTIFHLAALITIPYSYISPLAYIKTNIEGTYNILQSARELNLENILITSTSETYGTAQYVPIDETHPIVGQSPYSASKIGADQLAISYFKSFDLPVKIIRPFNTYGPQQSARAIIPTVITQLVNNKIEIKLGNLHPTRDLTYVKDTVSGMIEIAKSEKLFGEITNIGTNTEISISDLINLISNIMDIQIKIKSEEKRIRPEKSEVKRLICDNSKILKSTNWVPIYDLKNGLIETIQWLKSNIRHYKTNIYNL